MKKFLFLSLSLLSISIVKAGAEIPVQKSSVSTTATTQLVVPASQDLRFSWAYSGRQGPRATMEDAHRVATIELPDNNKITYLGIYDGHSRWGNGNIVAEFVAKQIPELFKDYLLKKWYTKPIDEAIKPALVAAYTELDDLILKNDTFYQTGTTALSAFIWNSMLYVAWAGDSRAILLDNKGAINLQTTDHKPHSASEKERIEKTGQTLTPYIGGFRICGLAVSRALGDHEIKLQTQAGAVIPQPDLIQFPLQSGDTLILACDGLWDVMTNTEIATFVHIHLAMNEQDLKEQKKQLEIPARPKEKMIEGKGSNADSSKIALIAQLLRDEALNRGSKDNISVLLLQVA